MRLLRKERSAVRDGRYGKYDAQKMNHGAEHSTIGGINETGKAGRTDFDGFEINTTYVSQSGRVAKV